MVDDPSNGELGRRLDTIQGTLNNLVGRPEYTARQESFEHRFNELSADVIRLESRHDEDITKVHKRIDDHEKGHTANSQSWRAILWPMLGAFVAAAAAIAVQLITTGGH